MKPIFRNSMFGFHKEDVARFIASQSKSHEKEMLDLKKDQEILVADYEKKMQALSEDLEKMAAIREQSEKQNDVFSKLRESAVQINDAIDHVLADLSAKEKQICLVNEKKSELEGKLEIALTFREKANRFDQLASVLSGIVAGKDPVAIQPEADSLEPVSSVDPVDLASLRSSVEKLVSLYQAVLSSVEELNQE